MAALSGQNIGSNFRGIINLGSTINSPLSGTLQAITDGDGVASPLQLSTTQMAVIGDSSGSIPAIFKMIPNTSVPTYGAFFTANYDNNQWLTIGKGSSGYLTFGDDKVYSEKSWGFGIASGALSARLHIKGDGTNPIARFENNSGSSSLSINASGTFHQYGSSGTGVGMYIVNQSGSESISGTALNWFSNITTNAGFGFRMYGNSNHNYTSGTGGMLEVGGNIVAPAGSANFRPLSIAYNINNSGAQSGTATGIFLNATETALNGMIHNLMDLQTGGVSQFRISKTDSTIYATNYNISASVYLGNSIALSGSGGVKVGDSRVRSDGDGNLTLLNDAANSFGLLKLGGTTNAFPAIKRNGAAIDFRLADDSAFCNIQANNATLNRVLIDTAGIAFQGASNTNITPSSGGWQFATDGATQSFHFGRLGFFDTREVSARLQIDSKTQGFLPPRMTTTERDLIATPAAGLMIYNTTTNRPNFYDGSAWVAL